VRRRHGAPVGNLRREVARPVEAPHVERVLAPRGRHQPLVEPDRAVLEAPVELHLLVRDRRGRRHISGPADRHRGGVEDPHQREDADVEDHHRDQQLEHAEAALVPQACHEPGIGILEDGLKAHVEGAVLGPEAKILARETSLFNPIMGWMVDATPVPGRGINHLIVPPQPRPQGHRRPCR